MSRQWDYRTKSVTITGLSLLSAAGLSRAGFICGKRPPAGTSNSRYQTHFYRNYPCVPRSHLSIPLIKLYYWILFINRTHNIIYFGIYQQLYSKIKEEFENLIYFNRARIIILKIKTKWILRKNNNSFFDFFFFLLLNINPH